MPSLGRPSESRYSIHSPSAKTDIAHDIYVNVTIDKQELLQTLKQHEKERRKQEEALADAINARLEVGQPVSD